MPAVEQTENKAAAGHAAVLDFYRLREEPFGVTPDPRFLYFSASHREALASLVYSTQTKRGFSALVAEPGMGKTTLLFHLLERLKGTARTAFLFRPDSDSRDLLESLLGDLGVHAIGQTIPQMHENLSSVLLEELNLGRDFVWVVDEAQDLEVNVLETIRVLSNFETPNAKLMHIILAGQPALAEKLARPELLQLRQRVSRIVQLEPLSAPDTAEYIAHRLRVCGYREQTLFTRETVRAIASTSLGIPRNINNLCFACLSLGFVERAHRISLEILRAVLEDYEPETPSETTEAATAKPSAMPAASWYEQNIDTARGSYALSGYESHNSRAWIGLALLGFILIPFGLLIAQSSSGSRQFDISTTPAVDELVGRLTGYDVRAPSAPPLTAPVFRPPQVPSNLAELIQDVPTEAPAIEEPVALSETPAPTPVGGSKARPARTSQSYGRRVVRVDRDQTIFQLALRYYGKANWTIVRKIRISNPGIREPFATIKKGQVVVLPDLDGQPAWESASKSPKRSSVQ